MASKHPNLVVVTGAGSGIGRATAVHFARAGAQVIVSDIDEAKALAAAASIGDGAYAYRLDVADADAWERFAANVRAEHGTPDLVVNNAGILISGSFLDHTPADWERIVGVNLMGVVHGCRVFARQMVDRGEGGQIVNIASAAAFVPLRLAPAYAVTKAAVVMLSECLRIELAGNGIGVTAICPTVINTNIARNSSLAGGLDAETEARFVEIATRFQDRVGWTGPDKVARAIARAARLNLAIVPVNPDAWISYIAHRLSPTVVRMLARFVSFDLATKGAEWLFPRLTGGARSDDDPRDRVSA